MVLAVAVAMVTGVLLITTSGHPRRVASAPLPSAAPLPRMLAGVPAHGVHTDLFLGGDNFWQVTSQPRAVLTGFLSHGFSPLLPRDHSAAVDQLLPVTGGVVALISDTSTGITYGALGRVVFIPSSNGPARVLARASVIAVGPGGQQVWVQTAVQPVNNGAGAPATFRSPTWAVNLDGRRVSPVLHLPLGLVGATEAGPLTQNLSSGALQLWDSANGRPMHLPLPPRDVQFVAAGDDRVVWQSFGPDSALHVTDLQTGADVAFALPGNWQAPAQTYPPPVASFDPSGHRLVLPLENVNSSENPTVENLFVADTATRTLHMISSTPLPVASSSLIQPDQMAGAWDANGLLWVLATSSYDYYQLGFWTGAGPLHVFARTYGSPAVLSAPGPG